MSLKNEPQYAFRRRLGQVHQPMQRVADALPRPDEISLDSAWRIHIPAGASQFMLRTAQDLQDYLAVSQGIHVGISAAPPGDAPAIVLGTTKELSFPQGTALPRKPRGYRLEVACGRITVCGRDERGTAQGCYALEEAMNLRLAPFLPRQARVREPLFAPRMIHSGWGCDVFPDSYLNAIAHAGIDALLIFVTGINMTNVGYLDFNDLIDRAERFGLDVYFYSYFKNRKHPEDPGAEEYYDSIYGDLIKAFPKVKGIVFVGESCEFPTHDERAKGWLRLDPPPPGHEHDRRPSPGWFPCRDYPQWLDVVKRVMRRHNPKLDIVFWTYNWGYQPAEPRLDLIRHLPTDISLQVTFEMFEDIAKEGVPTRCVDYTASFAGPGHYFSTEAIEARKRKIPLYAMANTGGLSWDIGVIPYEPIPYQWNERWKALGKARREWGLVGLMDSHHYGWWPSFVSELSKEQYWSNGASFEEHILAIARRDFGEEGAPLALKAWKAWSDAFRLYPPTNEDQYGPFRIGPAYPLLLPGDTVKVPDVPYAHHGSTIVDTAYKFHDGADVHGELRLLGKMKKLMRTGLAALKKASASTPAPRRENAEYLLNLGDFICHCIRTVINTKRWYLLLQQATEEASVRGGEPEAALLRRLRGIAEDELANTRRTIPLASRDSRLGWEPSMEYMCDPEHLRWKMALTRQLLDEKLRPEVLRALWASKDDCRTGGES